ncbi:hypothetical protein [Flavobacterium tructae]|uniref:hypothetical protein n=1 Tax=Flavobacterium tructae TaxID=1114873 RepID=UPI0035A945A4
MGNKFITVVLIFFSISLHSQNLRILKDSVYVDSGFLIIEELKINSSNEKVNHKVYAITQNTYEVFDKSFVGKPEDRIRMKKDTLSKRILNNTLRESNSGFEHYEIYYDKNKIVSFSIGIQSYGSPWEAIQYYCFDLNNGKRVGVDLFVDKPGLLKKIRKKLKDQDINLPLKPSDLLNFRIIIDKSKSVPDFYFSIFDTKNYRNSGYEEFSVHFEWREIESYIVPVFKKRLLTK